MKHVGKYVIGVLVLGAIVLAFYSTGPNAGRPEPASSPASSGSSAAVPTETTQRARAEEQRQRAIERAADIFENSEHAALQERLEMIPVQLAKGNWGQAEGALEYVSSRVELLRSGRLKDDPRVEALRVSVERHMRAVAPAREARIARVAANARAKLGVTQEVKIGEWLDAVGNSWSANMTIVEAGGTLYLASVYQDGSVRRVELTEVGARSSERRRFRDQSSDEAYAIGVNGGAVRR